MCRHYVICLRINFLHVNSRHEDRGLYTDQRMFELVEQCL